MSRRSRKVEHENTRLFWVKVLYPLAWTLDSTTILRQPALFAAECLAIIFRVSTKGKSSPPPPTSDPFCSIRSTPHRKRVTWPGYINNIDDPRPGVCTIIAVYLACCVIKVSPPVVGSRLAWINMDIISIY